jgi:hypothetical protein
LKWFSVRVKFCRASYGHKAVPISIAGFGKDIADHRQRIQVVHEDAVTVGCDDGVVENGIADRAKGDSRAALEVDAFVPAPDNIVGEGIVQGVQAFHETGGETAAGDDAFHVPRAIGQHDDGTTVDEIVAGRIAKLYPPGIICRRIFQGQIF